MTLYRRGNRNEDPVHPDWRWDWFLRNGMYEGVRAYSYNNGYPSSGPASCRVCEAEWDGAAIHERHEPECWVLALLEERK